jgi:hypothetical protein
MTKEIQAILDAVGVAIEDPEVHCVVVNRPPDRAPLLAVTTEREVVDCSAIWRGSLHWGRT